MPKPLPQHLKTGQIGEAKAVAYLLEKDYEIVHQNYRLGKAEIDIIAQKQNLLVFVEVKTRTNLSFGMPENDVTPRKAKRIVDAAEQYTFQQKWNHNIRFDIIAVIINKNNIEITHFEDAFY